MTTDASVQADGWLEGARKKLGAAAYLVKPLDLRDVQETLRQLLSVAPAAAAPPREALSLLVGGAPAIQRTFVEIAHACTTEAPVLITGPTGTGKTLTARVIHANSARRDAPFVTLHCSALPEQLLEAELFGHECMWKCEIQRRFIHGESVASAGRTKEQCWGTTAHPTG